MDKNRTYRYGFDPEKARERDLAAREQVSRAKVSPQHLRDDGPHSTLVDETIRELDRRIDVCDGIINGTHIFDAAGVTVVEIGKTPVTTTQQQSRKDIAA